MGSARTPHPKSLGRTAKLTAVWDFGGRISSQGVLFVVGIFLARLLTPADFGITAAARFFVTLASRLTQLGLNASLVRMKEMRPEHASSVFVTNLVMGIAAFATLYLSSPALGRMFGSPDVARILPVTAVVFLITPFGTVAAAMLNRHLRYRSTTLIQWLDGVSGSILALVLALFGWGYWSLVFGALGGTVLSTSAKVYFSPWRPSLRFSRSALRDTLSFGLGFQAKNLLQFGATNVDNLVVGRLLGVTSLGYYDKAYGLMHQLTNRMAFDASLMRIFAILMDQPARLRKALLKGIRATTLIMFPVLCFSAVAADSLVVVLFGPRWVPAIGPFRILALAGVLRSAMRAVNAANEALGLVWFQTLQQAVYLLVIVAGVAIGSRWGVTTAAIGVLVGIAIDAAISIPLLVRHSDVTTADLWAATWPSALTSGAMCGIVLAARSVSHIIGPALTPWADIIVMGITAGITYPALVLWTPFHSLGAVVNESVDDVAPWIRRWIRLGVLRNRGDVDSDAKRILSDEKASPV
jgi:O-antigen/teichoic acid export membrane protein